MKRHGMVRGRLVSRDGTRCVFECPRGHRTRKDYSRGKVTQRISSAGLAIFERGWQRDGVTFRCRYCADGTEPRAPGRRPALTAEQCTAIRSLYWHTSCSLERVGRHFDVSQGTISRVIDRKPPYQ